MKATSTAIFVSLFLAFVAWKSYNLYLSEKAAHERQTVNLVAVQKEAEHFKAKSGEMAVKVQSQELTIAELRKIDPSAIEAIKNIYAKPRLTKSFQQIGTETEKHVVTTLRDSVIMDTVRVSLVDYFDDYYDIQGQIRDNVATLDIRSRDQLTVTTYLGKRPKKFLFVRYGRRKIETAITNKNPDCKISIEKSIFIKKP